MYIISEYIVCVCVYRQNILNQTTYNCEVSKPCAMTTSIYARCDVYNCQKREPCSAIQGEDLIARVKLVLLPCSSQQPICYRHVFILFNIPCVCILCRPRPRPPPRRRRRHHHHHHHHQQLQHTHHVPWSWLYYEYLIIMHTGVYIWLNDSNATWTSRK